MNNSDRPANAVDRWPMNLESMGFTKREAIAVAAMQGLLANSAHLDTFSGNKNEPVPMHVASLSVEIADALLKALEQPQQ